MGNVQILLEVKETGLAVIKQTSGSLKELEGQTAKLTPAAAANDTAFARLQGTYLLAAGAAGIAATALGTLVAAAKKGAEAEEATGRLAFQLRGTSESVESLTGAMTDLIGGQLSLADSTRLASQALAQGFNAEQIKTFTQLAEAASDVLGGSIAQNFDQLVSSIVTGRTTMLKQIGILVDLEAEKHKLANATGRATSEITKMEEAQILLNAATAQAPTALARLSDGAESADDKFKRAEASIANFFHEAYKLALLPVVGFLDANNDQERERIRAVLAAGPKLTANQRDLIDLSVRQETEIENLNAAREAEIASLDSLAIHGRSMTDWLGVTTEQLFLMTDAEKGAAIMHASLRDHTENLRLEGEKLAESLIASSAASLRDMKVKEDHARLLAQETAETNKLGEATKVLAGIQSDKANAFLTRGTPDDALSRIRQDQFSGPGGDTLAGVQNALSLVKGLQGGDAGDKERLQRDLLDRLEKLAGSTVSEGGGIQTQPFGAGSQIIQPSSGQSFGQDMGAFGLRQPTVIQPTLPPGSSTITIPIYIGGEHLTTVTRKIDEQRRNDDALVGE